MKKFKILFFILLFIIAAGLVVILFYYDTFALRASKYFSSKNDFHKSSVMLHSVVSYYNFIEKTPFASVKKYEDDVKNIYIKIADGYKQSGDFKSANNFYNKILSEYANSNIENEAFINYLKIQIADNYSKYGYFNKSVPIYKEFKNWYPQNLIHAYLNMKDFEKAKEILFSDDIQETIKDGDDVDSANLFYLMLKYYNETGEYQKIIALTNSQDTDFEKDLMSEIILADLYYKNGEYDKSYDLYAEILSSPYLENSSEFNVKIKFAILSQKTNRQEQAVEIFNELQSKKLYKYSPQKICLQYYGAEIFPSKKTSLLKASEKLFANLRLSDESYYKNNLIDFCKANIEF